MRRWDEAGWWRYDGAISRTSPDIYFSADVETDGPVPGLFSMLSLGLAVAGRFDGHKYERAEPRLQTFYVEIRPISPNFQSEALNVNGLNRQELSETGDSPMEAMEKIQNWVREIAGDFRPVLVGYPVAFDWAFINRYFVEFSDRESPFGHASCLDIRSMYMAKAGTLFGNSGKQNMPEALRTDRRHSHNALEDSVEQAELFSNIFEWSPASERAPSSSRYSHP